MLSSSLFHPRLTPCYAAEWLDDDHILLKSETNSVVLAGRLYVAVLNAICQMRLTTQELLRHFDGMFSEPEIFYALTALRKEGYLAETTDALPPETAAYWNLAGIETAALVETLQRKSISLECVGMLHAEPFIRAFEAGGLAIRPRGDLRVVLADDYDRKELDAINRAALAEGQPWMLIKPVGVELWLGPLFVPGQTGCWECLVQRLRNHRPINALSRVETHPSFPIAFTPMSWQIAANASVIEIIKWLHDGQNERIEGKIATFDTHRFMTASHILTKRPQCPACGSERRNNAAPQPIRLRRTTTISPSKYGGYRDVSFEETLARYQHHVSPITGVAQTLEPYHHQPGSPVFHYISGYNTALKSRSFFWLNYHLRGSNSGKGRSDMQAKVGALCEAIERYSCTYQGEERVIFGRLDEFDGKAIHPNRCMNYSDTQYRDRERLNRECSAFYAIVPPPFDESRRIAWTPVYSLTAETEKYLPTAFCYTQYPTDDESQLFCYPDTNGNAAGNSLEEAMLQGMLEVVERDSAAIWWYNMLRRPAVNLASFRDSYFEQVEEYYHALRRHVWVLDLTTDLGIPAFAALSARMDDGGEIVVAFGAHIEAQVGVDRAIIELNQLLSVVNVPESERKAGKFRTNDAHFLRWLKTTTLENAPYLAPSPTLPAKTAADYPALCLPNAYDGIQYGLACVKKCGLEMLALDMTRPDIGLPVVKVVIPGLRHFWKRLAPGRLYDVPVRMGWLAMPLREDELNSIGVFI